MKSAQLRKTIINDIRAGLPVVLICQMHNVSSTFVYNLQKRVGCKVTRRRKRRTSKKQCGGPNGSEQQAFPSTVLNICNNMEGNITSEQKLQMINKFESPEESNDSDVIVVNEPEESGNIQKFDYGIEENNDNNNSSSMCCESQFTFHQRRHAEKIALWQNEIWLKEKELELKKAELQLKEKLEMEKLKMNERVILRELEMKERIALKEIEMGVNAVKEV